MYYIPDSLKGINLLEAGSFVNVDTTKISKEKIVELEKCGFEFSEEGICLIWYPDIDTYGVPYDSVLWESTFVDEYDMNDVMSQLIKSADHYLVYSKCCCWDGTSGYKITNSVTDCLYRDCDSTIIPIAVSKQGKTLTCRESNHDVWGSITYIIALTEREYRKLYNAEFKTITKFVNNICNK